MIEKISFGRTGHQSTRAIFGAVALGSITQDEADVTLALIEKYGINHIDVAASYGHAEIRLRPWLAAHRAEVFLATKTTERESEPAWTEINRSLERMGVDQLDLIQLHNLVDEKEWKTALDAGGALEAAVRAREEGLVRFIGVTGHGVEVARRHLQSLERFDFDSVLLPCNYVQMQNEAYAADFDELREVCRERNVAFQTIKGVTQRPWNGEVARYATWYLPFEDQPSIDRSVHWVLGHDGVFLNTVGDIKILPLVLDAVDRFNAAPSEEEMQELVARPDVAPLFV